MEKLKKIICALIAVILISAMSITVINELKKITPAIDTDNNTVDTNKQDDSSNIDYNNDKCVADLEEFKKINADTVAWLDVTGTDINNPVMQTDNNSEYLTKDENGVYSAWGAYFADYYADMTSKDDLIQNTVIYGHSELTETDSTKDGKMFSQLFRYTDIEFLKENPYIYLTINDETAIFEIFAVFYTGIDFYYINPFLEDDFDTFIDTVKEKNEYIFDTKKVTKKDKILTLSTCSHKYDNQDTGNHRFVVMGRLVNKTNNSINNVVVNENPQRP